MYWACFDDCNSNDGVQMIKAYEINKSESGPMARASQCFPLGAKRPAKQKWIAKNNLYLGNINGHQRIMAHVFWRTMRGKRFFLMDAVTGTLYRRSDGKCVTSDVLQLLGFKKEKNLTKKLMKIKESQITEKGESNEAD